MKVIVEVKYDEKTVDDNRKIYSVIDARYIGDFAIRVFFSDGHQKLVDFKPFLEQVKQPLAMQYLEEEKFKEFEIVHGNLNWNDYEMIFPLDDLYNNSILKETKTKEREVLENA